MHDACYQTLLHFLSSFSLILLSSLSFSRYVRRPSTGHILDASGLLIRRLFFGSLLGIAPVSGMTWHCGRRTDPYMALFVARLMLERFCLNGAYSRAEMQAQRQCPDSNRMFGGPQEWVVL